MSDYVGIPEEGSDVKYVTVRLNNHAATEIDGFATEKYVEQMKQNRSYAFFVTLQTKGGEICFSNKDILTLKSVELSQWQKENRKPSIARAAVWGE